MKRFYTLTLAIVIMFTLIVSGSHHVFAADLIQGGPLAEDQLLADPDPNGDDLREDHSDVETWITKWYGPDGNYENNGTFQVSGPMDFIDEGSGGKLNQASLSTMEGLLMTQDIDMEWGDDHGGTRAWTVFEIDPADGNNMNRGGPVDNLDTYALIVIDSPSDMISVMSPAHDDHAQIWINGEKWYNNTRWTGAARTILHNVEVDLQKGANVLLYRCGESGGSAYFNLHFDDATNDAVTIYPKDSTDKDSFFDEILPLTAVEPTGKLTTTWADIKKQK
ncbi:MAG: hypothetical protein OXU27_15135 [Candidatus Poribacteria bacterium]|nr:hypothetical protein [Candidatus Poribacteria bacterium]MDE0324720.1 hypothetical protein [Candidatus Poribacteria bacterium]